jgi:DNA polymerase-4
VDCDAFYAAVEKRDDPSLADQPVIVGGGRRGVVATLATSPGPLGVRSAMPHVQGAEGLPPRCGDQPDMARYADVARQVRAMMLTLTPAVEPLSIDEAFLDLTGTERLHGSIPAATLIRFQSAVEAQIGISVSIGLSHNKFLAKVASDLDKPRGFAVIGRPRPAASWPKSRSRSSGASVRSCRAAWRATAWALLEPCSRLMNTSLPNVTAAWACTWPGWRAARTIAASAASRG